ncbi:MAG: hypothetical protein ACLPSL_08845 [Smithella sp.]
MIRLRTASIVLLAACLLLVQGGAVAVYSSGVTIFVNSGTISSVTPGNQPPASIPGNTGTSTTTTTPGTQNISSFSATTTSATTSSSSNSSVSTSSQVQQQPNTTDTLFQTLEQSETSKLVRMPNFNPLSEEEPLLPTAASYKLTVCVSYNNIVAPSCRNKRTSSQASEILAAMILNKYLNGVEVRPFRVILPSAAPLTEQTQLLRKIETEAIAIIEAKMLEELKKSKIFLSESEEGRQKRLNIITQDAKQALQEADSGDNWSHNISNDRSSHVFQSAKAFKQFTNNMSVAQWGSH